MSLDYYCLTTRPINDRTFPLLLNFNISWENVPYTILRGRRINRQVGPCKFKSGLLCCAFKSLVMLLRRFNNNVVLDSFRFVIPKDNCQDQHSDQDNKKYNASFHSVGSMVVCKNSGGNFREDYACETK